MGVGVRRSETPHEVGVKLQLTQTSWSAVRLSDFLVVNNYWGSYPLGFTKLPFTSANKVTLIFNAEV